METYTILLAITEIQIKMTWKYHHIPIKLAKININAKLGTWQRQRERDTKALLLAL